MKYAYTVWDPSAKANIEKSEKLRRLATFLYKNIKEATRSTQIKRTREIQFSFLFLLLSAKCPKTLTRWSHNQTNQRLCLHSDSAQIFSMQINFFIYSPLSTLFGKPFSQLFAIHIILTFYYTIAEMEEKLA